MDYNLNHARILNAAGWWKGGTAIASSSATQFSADYAKSSLTYEKWRPASLPATWDLQMDVAGVIDAIGIAGHDMGSQGNVLRLLRKGASRTNLFTHSAEFDDAAWTKIEASVIADAGTAPDGTSSASLLIANNGEQGRLVQNVSVLADDMIVFSVFMKAEKFEFGRLVLPATEFEENHFASIDLKSGRTAASLGCWAGSADYGNGWWRFWISAPTIQDGTAQAQIRAATSVDTSSVGTNGDGVSGVLVWGAQFEQSLSLTSYIETGAATAESDWHELTTWTSIEDNRHILALFDEVSTDGVRLEISQGTVPTISVVKAGKALQIPRPTFSGHTPSDYAPNVVQETNTSENGAFLGMSVKRRGYSENLQWRHIPKVWIDKNLRLLQRALETEPCFIAWRPAEDEAVSFGIASPPTVSLMGVKDFYTMSLSSRGLGYE